MLGAYKRATRAGTKRATWPLDKYYTVKKPKDRADHCESFIDGTLTKIVGSTYVVVEIVTLELETIALDGLELESDQKTLCSDDGEED